MLGFGYYRAKRLGSAMLTLPLEDEAQCDCSGFMEEKESMCLGPHLFSPLPWCCRDIAAIFFLVVRRLGSG